MKLSLNQNTMINDQLVSHKAKIELAASNAVINAYSEHMIFVFDVAYQAWKWISEKHPESDKGNFEYVYDDEEGNEQKRAFEAQLEKLQKDKALLEEGVAKKV